jgi:peptidoglycan hydrolase-like protein with peptidoglycan-binding domain
MRLRSAVFAMLLAGTAIVPVAMAQNAGLTYSQPLSPDAVRLVQGKLHVLVGYNGPVDGNWSPASQAALRNFQQTRGLQVTGEMNPATAATMGLDPTELIAAAAPPPSAPPPAAAAPPPPAPPPLAPGSTPLPPLAPAAPAQSAAAPSSAPQPLFALSTNSVRAIQARLRQLGFYNGAIDGEWGPGSMAGVQRFQQTHGLPADGRLNGATVQAMGIDPASMQPR